MRKRLIIFIGVILGVLLAGSIRAETTPSLETPATVERPACRIS